MRKSLAVLLLIFTCLSGVSRVQTNSTPQSISELQSAIEGIMKKYHVPGAGVAIVSRGKTEWMAGIGKADVAANRPATADTLFRIGSVSKGFAALAALQLQEQGKLKLTDTVRQWVPDVAFSNQWEATDPVRLVHLMEHTTGFDDAHLREYAVNDPTPISLRDALAYGADSRVSRWRPGSRMSYCNSGPAVLAAVIEKASGERFEDYVQQHFFNPLGMEGASYFYTPEVQRRSATLYQDDGLTPYLYWHISYRPAGSINASAKDMANYVRFYLQRGSFNGKQLVQPSSIERMERCETLPVAKLGKSAGYGLYNYATCEQRFVFHGHGGAVMGGLTDMAYLPDQGCGYAVMINSGKGRAIYELGKLLRQYLTRHLTPPALPPVATVSSEVKQHYAGYYQEISPRNQWLYGFERLFAVTKLTIAADGRSATSYGLQKQQWVPMSDRLFRKEGETAATLALLPDADGEILIQSHWQTFKRVSGLRIWAQLAGLALISLLVLSCFIFALVQFLLKIFGKKHRLGPRSVRAMPFYSALLLAAFDAIIATGFLKSTFWEWGTPCLLSISVMLLSIAFPLTAVLSLYILYRNWNTPMNRIVYWHSMLVTLALLAVAIYYGCWGLIGLRLWA